MKKQNASAFSFIWQVIKPYKVAYIVMMIAPFASGIFPIVYNYAVKLLIDLFSIEGQITFTQSLKPILVFISAQAMLDIAWRLHNIAQLKSMPYIFESMLCKICEHCFNLPYTYFQNNFSGAIVAKIKGIGDKYYKIHAALEHHVSRPFLITVFSGCALALTNLHIFLFIVGFTFVYAPLAYYFFYKLSKIEGEKQESWYHLFGTVSDRVSNIFNIFSFARKKAEIQKIKDYYKDVHNPITIKFYKYDLVISIILAIIYWIFNIALFVYVIQLRNQGIITLGDIAFIMALTFAFMDNSWNATMQIKDFLEDIAAFKAAYSIMEVEQCTIDKVNASEISVSKGEINFKDLSFSYSESNLVLDNLNLHIKSGQKVGIVGHSGAGKSTLVSLLLKNFKPNKGQIIIDHQDIADVTSDSLRSNITYIPQDVILFHRSIGENIGYAKEDATQEEIEQAAKYARIHDFIISQKSGYETLVGERGIKLSGGQRQRIAIAQAFLKNTRILIIDEATSSLDSETEKDIQDSLNTIFDSNSTTVIAIAHRLSTIKHMDRIVVLEDGRVVEDGSFKKLLQLHHGKFKSLWEHQVNGMIV
ncbi:MAG: ABC transporter ATP-binding protein [Pseudomonadota bacterium]|jgi:ATP-binding cassette subfamily B protein|nr:ABC transporter ATP-binding protein/permease [Alphaproteobacteria bacterium]